MMFQWNSLSLFHNIYAVVSHVVLTYFLTKITIGFEHTISFSETTSMIKIVRNMRYILKLSLCPCFICRGPLNLYFSHILMSILRNYFPAKIICNTWYIFLSSYSKRYVVTLEGLIISRMSEDKAEFSEGRRDLILLELMFHPRTHYIYLSFHYPLRFQGEKL